MSKSPPIDSPVARPRESHDSGRSDGDARLKAALCAVGMGLWEWDVAADRMRLDPSMFALLAIEPENFGGRLADFLELVHAEDRDRLAASLQFSSKPSSAHDMEFRLGAGKDLRTLCLRCRVFTGEGGKPSQIVGVAWDISNRRASEEAYARDRYLLTSLMDHIPDSIYFKDRESRFIAINPAMAKTVGKDDPIEMIGKSDLDIFSADHALRAREDERRIIETGVPAVNLEEKETWPDGHVTWVSSTKMPLRDPRGRIIGTFGISRDITQRKRAEEELSRVAAELRHKNQALEEDLQMARELQNALLPQQFPCFPRGSAEADSAIHFHHFFRPSSTVGGDFFDVFEIEENVAGLFICDVMGHGVRAALVASILRALLNELQPLWKAPGEFMIQLNRALRRTLKHTQVPLFASAFYAVTDLAAGTLAYANAGHPCPLRLKGGGVAAEPHRLNGVRPGPALGLLDDPAFPAGHSPLSMPETLLFFTDGLFEVESPEGVLFDYKSLSNAVAEMTGLKAASLCDSLLRRIRGFAGNDDFADDVCLIAMEIDHLACS